MQTLSNDDKNTVALHPTTPIPQLRGRRPQQQILALRTCASQRKYLRARDARVLPTRQKSAPRRQARGRAPHKNLPTQRRGRRETRARVGAKNLPRAERVTRQRSVVSHAPPTNHGGAEFAQLDRALPQDEGELASDHRGGGVECGVGEKCEDDSLRAKFMSMEHRQRIKNGNDKANKVRESERYIQTAVRVCVKDCMCLSVYIPQPAFHRAQHGQFEGRSVPVLSARLCGIDQVCALVATMSGRSLCVDHDCGGQRGAAGDGGCGGGG